MKEYTGMYIIRPTLEESAIKAIISEISEIFTTRDSKVLEVNEWGIKELAYEIKKHKTGYYFLLNVEAPVEAINEFVRKSNISDNVIRHLVTKIEK